jgi:hypothetical protein
MATTKIDSLISKVAPRWAYDRAIARHNLKVVNRASMHSMTQGGYAGGNYGRGRPAPARSTCSEDIAAGWTYETMIANAMQLYRDDPMCKSLVDVCSTYMGESRPTATTTDKAFNQESTQFFNEVWWPQADARGRSGIDYGEFQNLWDKWCWFGGDMLFVLVKGQLMPYEGVQIKTPSKLRADKAIVNGIRVQASSPWRVSHYYLADRKPGSTAEEYKRIRANEAIYAGARNWRPSMLRAVPDLHGVIDALYRYNKTNDNVQRRIEFESMLFSAEKKGAVGNVPGSRLLMSGDGAGEPIKQRKTAWGMGLQVTGDPDKDFKLFQMQNPSNNYVQVMEYLGMAITAGTGFPYEIVMHKYTSGSYTANRAARLDFAKALMSRWAWRNKVLNQRAWNWRVAKAIKDKTIRPAPVDEVTGVSQWHKAAWTLPHFPHIDEGKEVVADIKQWGCGQESISDWAQQKGQTRNQMLDAHDMDIKEMQERADRLEIPLEQYMGQLFTASAAPDAEDAAPLDDDSEQTGVEKWLT